MVESPPQAELRRLLRAARHWWWLLVLGPLLVSLATYVVNSNRPPLYRANATLGINLAASTGNIDTGTIQASKGLGETYRQLVASAPVLEPVVELLSLPDGVEGLRRRLLATAVRDTLLLDISVSDTDPERAAATANAVAERFIVVMVQPAESATAATRTELDARIYYTEQRIDETQRQIANLQVGTNVSSAETEAKLATFRWVLSALEQEHQELLRTADQLRLNAAEMNALTLIVPAKAPVTPYAPRTVLFTMMGALIGLVVASGAVGLLEYLDTTVKAGTEVGSLIGRPLLAAVDAVPKLRPGRAQLFVVDRPKSPAAESIRLLRANLEFAAAPQEMKRLMITSTAPREGKTTITANLAVAMAQTGSRVVVIDADLRCPALHHVFGVENTRGLSILLQQPEGPWRWAAFDLMPNLKLIPSGPVPPNPADLLSSGRLRDLLTEIAESVDFVLIDVPPLRAVSDPHVVANHVDGILLVCKAGHTRVDALRGAVDGASHAPTPIVGIVLNQQPRRGGDRYFSWDRRGPKDLLRNGVRQGQSPQHSA